MAERDDILDRLMHVIATRRDSPDVDAASSYTRSLLDAGTDRVGEKVSEEAAELIKAARLNDVAERRRQVIHEAADLQYHVLVLLASCDVTFGQVERELRRRFGTSGIEEKASRSEDE